MHRDIHAERGSTRSPAHRGVAELPSAVRAESARALVALGDVDGAERLIPDHSDARTKRHRVHAGHRESGRGGGAWPYAVAVDGYKLAIALWRTHGFQLELGLTRIGAARCLIELDRWDDAAAIRWAVRATCCGHSGATPSLAEIDELLGDDLERRLGSAGA